MISDTLKNITRTKLRMDNHQHYFTSHWEKQIILKQNAERVNGKYKETWKGKVLQVYSLLGSQGL